MYHFQKPPLVLSGLILGLVALANLLSNYNNHVKLPLMAIALCLYGLLIYGIVRNKEIAMKQLKSPLVASVFPTFFMVTMLLASQLVHYHLKGPGQVLWWFGCIGDLVLMTYYILRFVLAFSWDNVFPSWTVLFVGIAMTALTAPTSCAYFLGQCVFWFCLSATFLIFPVIYKKTYHIGLPEANLPNISTFCAPLSLLLAGYLVTFATPNPLLVILLMVISQAVYFFVLVQLPKLLNRPFNPGFSAFTFPFVISATSLRMAVHYCRLEKMLGLLVTIEVLIATGLVGYVLVTYLIYLCKKEVSQ